MGETAVVLLPCPIGTNEWVEDTEVVSAMKVGATGVFMPQVYDETSYREENGARFYWLDIARYGFADGVRFAFLETDRGLLFDRYSYSSIAAAESLAEIEAYVQQMIGKRP